MVSLLVDTAAKLFNTFQSFRMPSGSRFKAEYSSGLTGWEPGGGGEHARHGVPVEPVVPVESRGVRAARSCFLMRGLLPDCEELTAQLLDS